MQKLLAAFAAALASFAATPSSAQECVFPLHPGPLDRVQPDGSTIQVFQRGDAFANWLEDAEGYPIVESAAGFVYARLRSDGAAEGGEEGDQQLDCMDCQSKWTFTASEAAFFTEKG